MGTILLALLLTGAPDAGAAKPEPTPTLKFDKAPLVGHAEGDVWAVPNQADEVFVLNQKLYLRTQSGRWFYSANLNGYWYDLDADRVPEPLKRIPLGKYRKWKAKGQILEPADLGPPGGPAQNANGQPPEERESRPRHKR